MVLTTTGQLSKSIVQKIIFILFLISPFSVFAEDPTIFDMRKPVLLSDSDPVYRDFYINGGTESGLQPGMIVMVKRNVTLYDHYQNRSPGDLNVSVGRIKIIQAQKGISVARHYEDLDRSEIPILEEDYIMIGDRIDVRSAEMEKKKSSRSSASTDGGTSKIRTESVELSLEIKAPDLSVPAPAHAAIGLNQEPLTVPAAQ